MSDNAPRKETGGQEETKYAEVGTVFHSYAELKGAGNRPDEVDPKRKEMYLQDDEFQKVFEMSKAEFQKMPAWKQADKKKKVGLF